MIHLQQFIELVLAFIAFTCMSFSNDDDDTAGNRALIPLFSESDFSVIYGN